MDHPHRRARGSTRWIPVVIGTVLLWTGQVIGATYGVLSLVGDRLTVVGEAQTVSSNLDRNQLQVITLKDTALDDGAALAAKAVIERTRPEASVTAFRARERSVYVLRDAWLDTDAIQVQELLTAIGDQFPAAPDARLLLIAPYRGDLQLRTDRNYLGTGKAAGLGFYVDFTTRMRDDSLQVAKGFLGVFTNFQLVLINMATRTIEAQQRITVGTTVAAARAKDGSPWNALSPTEKMTVLASMMKKEIERALPAMLGSAK
jgi:hypothetical protein